MTSEEKDLGKGKGRGKGQDKGQGKGKGQKAGTNEAIIGMVEKNELNITQTLPGTRGLDTIKVQRKREEPEKMGTGKGQTRKKGERKG
jgi:hypothetical protein